MNSIALTLVILGLVFAVASWASYLATVPSGNTPVRPVFAILLQVGAIALAGVGIAHSVRAGGAAVSIPIAATAVMLAVTFLFLLTQRKTPLGNITVAVGDKILAFQATDSEGKPFTTEDLSQRRILLKFFRGGW